METTCTCKHTPAQVAGLEPCSRCDSGQCLPSALTNAVIAAREVIAVIETQLAEITRIKNDLKVIANLDQATWPHVSSLNHTKEQLQNAINHWSFVK